MTLIAFAAERRAAGCSRFAAVAHTDGRTDGLPIVS